MGKSLLEMLESIEDVRDAEGRRYRLVMILAIAIVGTMSGCLSYRGLADFAARHAGVLGAAFHLRTLRMPSAATLRRVLQAVDMREVTQVFTVWAQAQANGTAEHLAIDGKAIGGTATDAGRAYQNFVSTVSAFSTTHGMVRGAAVLENSKAGEEAVVRTLCAQLQLRGCLVTLDALHCKKNTCSGAEPGRSVSGAGEGQSADTAGAVSGAGAPPARDRQRDETGGGTGATDAVAGQNLSPSGAGCGLGDGWIRDCRRSVRHPTGATLAGDRSLDQQPATG